MISIPLPTRRATTRLAQAIARRLEPSDLVLLDGGLGAGKTFLVRALLRGLGVGEAVPVPSPTFALMNEYDAALGARLPVVHADLYRLLGAPPHGRLLGGAPHGRGCDVDDQIGELGLRPRRAEGWALVVEWGGDHEGALGGDALRVTISIHPRIADIGATGERSAALARAIGEELRPSSTF